MSEEEKNDRSRLDRRTMLRGGAAAALAAPLGVFGAQAFPFRVATPGIDFSQFPICKTASDAAVLTGAPRKLKLSWNAGAVCLVPVPVAIDHGFFKKYNLDVELVNYSGSTDQLLEAIATGKSDAGLGMALRWLKPLEQGFDVKIAAGTHGGCMRVLSRVNSGVRQTCPPQGQDRRGRRSRPDQTRISSRSNWQNKASIPTRMLMAAYPGNLLQLAVEKGEVQAFLASDPIAHIWLKLTPLTRKSLPIWTANTRTKPAAFSDCAASLVREEPQVARAHHAGAARCGDVHRAKSPMSPRPLSSLTRPKRRACRICRPWSDTTPTMHHPVGEVLKRELKAYADDLKSVSVFKASTDTAKFAERIYVDVYGV